jgi:sugar/nucleoside kinase (ribokinase family)
VAEAAGRSTNIEPVTQQVKLGGNGPIMANALAAFGTRVTYLGALGWPEIHPVFRQLAERADEFSICEPGRTMALEFEDGKVMLTNSSPLNDVTWANVQGRFGRAEFERHFATAELVAFVNWTMIPYMSDLWASLQEEMCPGLGGPRRRLFFDLADPQKRERDDILRALGLIEGFEAHFDVTLGLNEKETWELAGALGLPNQPPTRESLAAAAVEIARRVPVSTLVVHPVRYALAVSGGAVTEIDGPLIRNPLITTGAGDHFNAGFCLGQLLGFGDAEALLCGVSTSGYYVRNASSPSVADVAGLMRDWPEG